MTPNRAKYHKYTIDFLENFRVLMNLNEGPVWTSLLKMGCFKGILDSMQGSKLEQIIDSVVFFGLKIDIKKEQVKLLSIPHGRVWRVTVSQP